MANLYIEEKSSSQGTILYRDRITKVKSPSVGTSVTSTTSEDRRMRGKKGKHKRYDFDDWEQLRDALLDTNSHVISKLSVVFDFYCVRNHTFYVEVWKKGKNSRRKYFHFVGVGYFNLRLTYLFNKTCSLALKNALAKHQSSNTSSDQSY